MSKTVKKIVIGLLIAFVIFNVYRLVTPKNTSPSTQKNGLAAVGTAETTVKKESIEKLLALLLSVNNINLSNAIFTKPEFQSLKDFSLREDQQNLVLDFGRKNPFLPIGDESAGAYTGAPGAPVQSGAAVKTNPVTSGTSSSALLVGENGITNTLEQYFEWGTTAVVPLGQVTPTVAKTASKTYTYTLGNLIPDTAYFYRAVVKTKDNKTIVGEIQSFKTPKL